MLDVRDLVVAGREGVLVDHVSFDIDEGERVGLIGASGSGKSLTALALMGLLPEGLSHSGSIRFDGGELVGASERALSRRRGTDLSMVFQEPMTALNPAMRIGKQVAETMTVHGTRDRAGARRAAVELLDLVGLAHTARAYPHQLSGGQRQRVVLAIAFANSPRLLVCDEPTTALDVTVQARILELITTGVRERGSSLLFISHDLAVVASVCERVLVLDEGRIVEHGPTGDVLRTPRHEYTARLLAASSWEVS
ncbi:ABC transporter ATP-binding protein [Prauserella marina]|nr:ABC transporter ATP-binding protein [Prauserella marina]